MRSTPPQHEQNSKHANINVTEAIHFLQHDSYSRTIPNLSLFNLFSNLTCKFSPLSRNDLISGLL